MNRRGFIGSIIGMCAGSAFYARTLIEAPQRVILPYRLMFNETQHGLLHATAVKSIIPHKNGFEFIAEDLNVTQTMVYDGVSLFDDKGNFIRSGKFKLPVSCCDGDTLKVNYALEIINHRVTDVDKLVQLYLEYNKDPEFGFADARRKGLL